MGRTIELTDVYDSQAGRYPSILSHASQPGTRLGNAVGSDDRSQEAVHRDDGEERWWRKGTNMNLKAAAVLGAVVGALLLLGVVIFILSSVFS